MDEQRLPDLPERQLWCSVLSLAAFDMRAGRDLRRAVVRWMTPPDFATVCELAELEPAMVANYLKRGGTRHGIESLAA